MSEKRSTFSKVGMVGVGSMGSMLSLLMVEHGCNVFCFDPSKDNLEELRQHATDLGVAEKINLEDTYEDICRKIKDGDKPRLIMFSTPHGAVGDELVDGLQPHLESGDIIIDCANEHYANTERRQKRLEPHNIHYIGCGVSGGYQSARSGPSFSPGGDAETLNKILPFLRQLAATDDKGEPCVNAVGPGSSGHYTKMVHNGIEQGMMSTIAEAWLILVRGLGMKDSEVSDIFRSWNQSGPLRDCFLVAIGTDILRAKDKSGHKVLPHIRDKVVQDVDETEGTGTWTCEEALAAHVPAATIISAHLFRCASADFYRRAADKAASGGGVKTERIDVGSTDDFVNALEKTVYFCFLACYAQGLDLLRSADKAKGWKLKYDGILQLWRGGAIIQANHVLDVLTRVYKDAVRDHDEVEASQEVSAELAGLFPAVKEVVIKSIQANMFVPAISQSLEFYKYSTSTDLPTQFMEAQLDYFGEHMFEKKEDPPGPPKTGPRHFEWKEAKGRLDKE